MPVKVQDLVIMLWPDPVLRRKADPVPAITSEVRAVAERMLQLMSEAEGLGLSAPQVGLSWRLFVARVPCEEEAQTRVFVNPHPSAPARETETLSEGCLSIPEVTGEIQRPSAITIQATDLEGRDFTLRGEGLEARVWQHECDHLDGVLILDRMRAVDRMACQGTLKELEAQHKAR